MMYRWFELLGYITPIIGYFTELGGAVAAPIAAVVCVALIRRPLFDLAHAIATRELPEDE
jgi:hypothetical protein